MDSTSTVMQPTNDTAEQLRFDSFKLGWGAPMPATNQQRSNRHSHARSHSRNTSVSSSISAMNVHDRPLSASNSHNSLSSNPARNSHHKRRSSVSTRRESAELMGVTVPELPPSTSMEDNVNLGEKDSIRRRALWALEGRPDVAYSKVDIPDLAAPDADKKAFELSSKPSFPPGLGSRSLMENKRDSFKILTSASKDQLSTLVEEEEEEDSECVQEAITAPVPPPTTPVTPATPAREDTQVFRSRPATFSLRPLSLTPETLASNPAALPTPSPTPVSATRSGLKRLSLTSTLPVQDFQVPASRRPHNLHIATEPSEIASLSSQHHQTPSSSDGSEASQGAPARRSSISYKSSSSGLPTPEMTPTFPRRRFSNATISSSISSIQDSSFSSSGDDNCSSSEFFPASTSAPSGSQSFLSGGGPARQNRTMSVSEQHFLFKSHNILLTRIQDLEKALSIRRRESSQFGGSSRPVSMMSDVSSTSGGEPNEEMLRLISDLKAERDDLKGDVDGWRTRVGDLEKQIGMFATRVENERRDAFVARSRLAMLEADKRSLEDEVSTHNDSIAQMKVEMENMRLENERLKQENRQLAEDKQDMLDELMRWKSQSSPSKSAKADLTINTSKPLPRRIVVSDDEDDSSSEAEMEPFTDDSQFGFSMSSVSETTDVDDKEDEDEDDVLAGYEDEEEGDAYCHSPSSSFGSDEAPPTFGLDMPTSPVTPTMSSLNFESKVPSIPPRPTHRVRGSLSRTWAFPTTAPTHGRKVSQGTDKDDKFFVCLDEDGEAVSSSSNASPMVYDYEASKGLFSRGLAQSSSDDDVPFFFGSDAQGVVVESSLDVVGEEDEDAFEDAPDDQDSDMEIGGIKITFTPPQESDESSLSESLIEQSPITPPSSQNCPALSFEDSDDEEDAPAFNFGRPQSAKVSPSPMITPKSLPRASGIPRASLVRSISPSFTLPASHAANSYNTPPTKRPSFIPQAASRSPTTPTKQRVMSPAPAAPAATFIRQPQRKSLGASKLVKSSGYGTTANEGYPMNKNTFRSIDDDVPPSTHAVMTSVDLTSFDATPVVASHMTTMTATIMTPSSSLTSRLSLPALSSFLPTTWTPSTSKSDTGSGFVSRDAQLVKLKIRMLSERTRYAVKHSTCQRCDAGGEEVCL